MLLALALTSAAHAAAARRSHSAPARESTCVGSRAAARDRAGPRASRRARSVQGRGSRDGVVVQALQAVEPTTEDKSVRVKNWDATTQWTTFDELAADHAELADILMIAGAVYDIGEKRGKAGWEVGQWKYEPELLDAADGPFCAEGAGMSDAECAAALHNARQRVGVWKKRDATPGGAKWKYVLAIRGTRPATPSLAAPRTWFTTFEDFRADRHGVMYGLRALDELPSVQYALKVLRAIYDAAPRAKVTLAGHSLGALKAWRLSKLAEEGWAGYIDPSAPPLRIVGSAPFHAALTVTTNPADLRVRELARFANAENVQLVYHQDDVLANAYGLVAQGDARTKRHFVIRRDLSHAVSPYHVHCIHNALNKTVRKEDIWM